MIESSSSAAITAVRRMSARSAGDDLLEAERLRDVVVAAGGETGDAVLDGVARR